jgi:hypothetical protein
MVGDLQMTEANMKWKCKTKIYKFPAHEATYPTEFFGGFAGDLGVCLDVAAYLSMPDTFKPPRQAINGLILTADKKIFSFNYARTWMELDVPYAAAGSGMYYAIAAMDAGASPIEAMKIVSKRDPYTGMGYKSLKF